MIYRFGLSLLAPFLLGGCLLAAFQNPDISKQLTPEQIAAYRDLNMDVAFCFSIGGPPPVGNSMIILLPKGTKPTPMFGDGCHIVNQPQILTPAGVIVSPKQ